MTEEGNQRPRQAPPPGPYPQYYCPPHYPPHHASAPVMYYPQQPIPPGVPPMHPLHAHNRYAYPLPPSHHHPQQSIAAQHQHQHHASNHMTTQAPAINSLDNANVGRGVVSSVSVEPSIMMSRQNNTNNGSLATTTVDPYQAVRKKTAGGCTCKKSKCLKLYCQCFASSFLCGPECSCASCHNTSEFVSERKDAIRVILERNPNAFQTKFQQTGDGTSSARIRNSSSVRTAAAKGVAGSSTNTTSVVVEHKVGCKCRKSSCLKKYCECYSANVKCSSACRCINCYNVAPPAMGFRRNGVPVVVNSCGMIQESSLVETLKQNNNNNKHVVVSDPSRLMMPMMHQTFGQSNSSSSRDDVYERVVYAPISTAVEESRSDAPTGVQRNKFIREVSNTKELSSTETEEDAAAALMALMMGGGNSLSRKRQSHRHSTTTAMCSSQLGGDSIGSTNSSNSNGPTMVSVTASTASASFDTNSSVSFDHAPDNEDSNDGHHQSSNGYNSASAPPSKRMRRISEESMQKWPSPPPPSFSKHESRNPSPEHESIHRGGQAMISLSQIQHRMPFGMTPCDVSRYTPTMKRKSLPKGLSYRKICSRCGKTRSEHGELGFGNKCIYHECARCLAGIQCHEKANVPMGFLCTLTKVQGATPGASKEYDLQLSRLATEAISRQNVKKMKGDSSSSDETDCNPSIVDGPSPIINKV